MEIKTKHRLIIAVVIGAAALAVAASAAFAFMPHIHTSLRLVPSPLDYGNDDDEAGAFKRGFNGDFDDEYGNFLIDADNDEDSDADNNAFQSGWLGDFVVASRQRGDMAAKPPPSELYTTRVFVRAFSPTFTVRIDNQKEHPVVSVELLRAVLPSSGYTVETGYNDAMIVRVGAGEEKTVRVPEGVYNVSTLAAALKSCLASGCPCGFEVTVDPLTHKCTLSNPRNSFTVFFPGTGSIAYELGFETDVLYTSTSGCGCGHGVTSVHRVDISPPRYAYLLSDELDAPGFHESGILAEIPMISSLQYTDYSSDSARRRKFASALRLRQLTCTLAKPASRRPHGDAESRVSRSSLVPYNTNGLVATFTIELTRARPIHHAKHAVRDVVDE